MSSSALALNAPTSSGFKQKDIVLWVKPEETREKIDWDCPCLRTIKEGPCATETMAAMDCAFAVRGNDEALAKGCASLFQQSLACMQKYPDYYKDVLEHKDK